MNDSFKRFQARSIISFLFLVEFNKLEKTIQKKLKESIPKVSHLDLNKLYFRYGGRIATTYYSDDDIIQLTKLEFKENEDFGRLSISEIVELNKDGLIISELDFDIPSFQRNLECYTFFECIRKIIKMRNKLAHNSSSYNFPNSTVIDLFSSENIEKFIYSSNKLELIDVDIALIDDETIKVASNLYYLIEINNRLEEKDK